MPGCGMHSRPKLAEKARINSLIKINNNNNNNRVHSQPFSAALQLLLAMIVSPPPPVGLRLIDFKHSTEGLVGERA